MTTTWTAVEERIAWTATEDPSYQFVTLRPTTVTLESGGGGGAVDSVNGATGTVVLDAGDVGALASGSGYNTANGWLKLDGSGTAPDSTLPASIARDSEVSSAISTHAAATDPHGDRAYADGLVDDLSGVTNAAAARSNLGLGALATLSAVSSAEIVDGTIVNADIGAGAAIALSKLAVDPLARANHTGTQAQSTVSGLVSDLAGKAATVHTHSGADITSGTVPPAVLGTGAANATTFLRGDQTWAAAGGSETLPASIIDAKGDVIVGTAADTAARLAVGADGQVLTADSGEASGVKWAAAAGGDSVPYVSGNYYSIQGSSSGAATTAGLNAAGRLGAHPVYLPAGSFQSIGVNIQVGAVSTWRFGIYPNNPATMTPVGQTLLKDMGTISTNITGIASASSTFTISTAGIYWVATLCDSYTASPAVYGFATGMVPPPALPWLGLTAEAVTSSGFISPLIGALSVTTGAMPATFPALGGSVFRAINYVPLLFVRAA